MLSEERINELANTLRVKDGDIHGVTAFTRAIEAAVLPEGYALVSIAQLKTWGHYEALDAMCQYPLAAAPKLAQAEKQGPFPFSADRVTYHKTAAIGAIMPCGTMVTNVKEAYEAGQKAQVSPLDLMECLQDRPVEPSKAVQGKCVAQAEKQEPVAWVGCGDCDCEFPCYHGKTTCLRLPTEKDEPVGYMHPVAKKAISLADLNGQSEWIRAEWIKGAPLYATPFAKPSEVADAYTQGRNDGWEAAMLHKQEPVNYEPVARKIKYGSLVFLEGYHELPDGTLLYTRPQPDLTVEVERLKAERDSFYMDYRMKCDLETKQQAERIAALEAAAREVMGSLHSINLCSVNSMSSRNEMQRLNNEAILTLDAVLGNAEITGG